MKNLFSQYLDQQSSLEERLQYSFDELRVPNDEKNAVTTLLELLRSKNPVINIHYNHSIRVGLLAKRIACFMHLDEKALFYAGLLHDIGKCQTDLDILGKTEGWTTADMKAIKQHVIDSHRLLKNRFPFTAEIVMLHHRFQTAGYPIELPSSLHNYNEGTKAIIMMYGRILALADVYDALHRCDNKFGARQTPLSEKEIKIRMLELNPDQRRLILELYDAEIFTISAYPKY